MPNPDLASERRAFEAWARPAYQWDDGAFEQDERVVFPHYTVGLTFAMFKSWLARSAVPNPDGYVLVPVEPTEAMMDAVDCAGEKRNWLSGKAWIAGWKAMITAALTAHEPKP